MTAPAEIHALNDRLKSWLFEHAFPLWWEVGADRVNGGWFEKIGLDGKAVDAPRRARVAGRQVYVYAMAGIFGWSGPWREAVQHGLRSLLGPFARDDGLFHNTVSPDGTGGAGLDPYDQAFALLAMASAYEACCGDFEGDAIRTREAMKASGLLREDGGVLHEGVLKANPMMHLFEAVQAWAAVGKDTGWVSLADGIAATTKARMIDPATGALCELFEADWRVDPDCDVEPGHQFEWGWLLTGWLGRNATADRLIEIGETRGVENGVAIFSLDQQLAPRDRSARLWSQTERLHAHAVAGNWEAALNAAAGLQRYLDVPVPGTWRDRLLPDGTFVEEPAPGSSLYHIVSAAMALDAACGG